MVPASAEPPFMITMSMDYMRYWVAVTFANLCVSLDNNTTFGSALNSGPYHFYSSAAIPVH